MKKTDTDKTTYIQELEDKIVSLSFELKDSKNELNNLKSEHFQQLQKLIHNLKNPVGIAYSFSEIIKEKEGSINPESLIKYSNAISNSTQFSIEMLNALGQLNRLYSPSFSLNLEKTNYLKLVDSVIEKKREKALAKNITIEKIIPYDELLLNVDIQEIEVVLNNVIDNSIRFSGPNSKIQINLSVSQNHVETKISDEGIGISENNLHSLCNEFYVINTYDQNSKKCIGLGLSIAKKIIDSHKGKLKIESKFNEGTIVKIKLPKN